MSYFKQLLLALAAAFFLAGCGGGGGASTATITADNARDLAVAGTEAAKGSATADSAAFTFKSGSSTGVLSLDTLAKQVADAYYAPTPVYGFCDTGSFIIDDVTGSATFTDCVIDTITINGSMTVSGNQNSFSYSASLSITENGVTESISFSGSCTISNSSAVSCTFSSTYTGIDGRTYITGNMSVSGDYSSGYTVSGSVTDPDHGVVSITTTSPVYFNCSDGRPSSGQIVVSGNGSATVTYNDCTSFSVNFDGVTTTYDWADI
jgi:hypothetical protein